MLFYRIFLIFGVNACITAAHPTTSAQPEPEPPATIPSSRHRGQHSGDSATQYDCSACGEHIDTIICATDGLTYINECSFQCAKLENSNLDIKYSNVCVGDRETCNCVNDPDTPVCGTDGKTYERKCKLLCDNWVRAFGSTVQVAHEGPCKDQNTYLNDSNKPAHYKDTATRYSYASSRYIDAEKRFNEAAKRYHTAASRYVEKATHHNNAKVRHNYPKTLDEAHQNIHDATHFIDEAIRYIDEATRHVGEATRRIDAASAKLDELDR